LQHHHHHHHHPFLTHCNSLKIFAKPLQTCKALQKNDTLVVPCAPGRFCCRPWVVGRDWRLVKPRWMNWTGWIGDMRIDLSFFYINMCLGITTLVAKHLEGESTWQCEACWYFSS
jgi:hypothetical protein